MGDRRNDWESRHRTVFSAENYTPWKGGWKSAALRGETNERPAKRMRCAAAKSCTRWVRLRWSFALYKARSLTANASRHGVGKFGRGWSFFCSKKRNKNQQCFLVIFFCRKFKKRWCVINIQKILPSFLKTTLSGVLIKSKISCAHSMIFVFTRDFK